MKNLSPGYYRPTDDEFEELWANCTFVPDTNVLLNLYRTSPSAKETLMEIFEQISDRLWIPHQVALEYQTRRLGVISKQLHAYREVQEYLQKEAGAISGKLSEYRRHAFLDIDLLNARIEKVFSSIRKQVEKQQKVHPDWLGNDPIHEELTTLFEGKVGIPYTDEQHKLYIRMLSKGMNGSNLRVSAMKRKTKTSMEMLSFGGSFSITLQTKEPLSYLLLMIRRMIGGTDTKAERLVLILS